MKSFKKEVWYKMAIKADNDLKREMSYKLLLNCKRIEFQVTRAVNEVGNAVYRIYRKTL